MPALRVAVARYSFGGGLGVERGHGFEHGLGSNSGPGPSPTSGANLPRLSRRAKGLWADDRGL